jgi:hypothetical protein
MEKFTRIADEMNTWAHVSNFRKAIETSKKYLLYAHVYLFAYFKNHFPLLARLKLIIVNAFLTHLHL